MTRHACAALWSLVAAVPTIGAEQTSPSAPWLEAGLGVGMGTGRFGGPALAPLFAIGGTLGQVKIGVEWIAVVRREAYTEGGFGVPVPPVPRTRTVSRWALSVVGRLGSSSGPFAKGGVGLGAVGDIDTSVLDAAPLRGFTAVVGTLGVGHRWRMGTIVLTPRTDLLVHVGSRTRVTGVLAVAVGTGK